MFFASLKKLLSRKSSKKSQSTASSSTTTKSIASTHLSSRDGVNFKFEGGRRFQNENDVSYVLPNDYDELDRVHQQHWAFKYILQCNYFAPIEEDLKNGIKVLDSGCGPATWLLDMAETYPKSKFYGVDASLVFPQTIKPSNVEVTICNIAKGIPFPDNTFDYIHQRLLILGLTGEDWDNALKELFRVLKPGGYIELFEGDAKNFMNGGPLLSKVCETMGKMAEARNLRPHIMFELKDRLLKAGFVDQKFQSLPFKLNGHDKKGELMWDDYKQIIIGLKTSMAMTNPEWENDEVYFRYIEECSREAIEYNTHLEFGYHTAIKPITE